MPAQTTSWFRVALILALMHPAFIRFRAAQPQWSLSVPAMERPLHLSVTLPSEARLDGARNWTLVESGGSNAPLAVDLIPAPADDGVPSRDRLMLVGTIPASARKQGDRRFVLEDKGTPSSPASTSPFRFTDINQQSLGLWEGPRPVLVYNHGIISKKDVPADRNRSTYVHPIYGLDGEVLTDDFPQDHYHHRGLFWAWPHVQIEGANYSSWDLRGIQQRFSTWLDRRSGKAAAVLGVENGWFAGEKKVVQERVWFTVFPATPDAQAIDVDLTWIPTEKPVTLVGAEEKSYGGLTLRFAPRTGTLITTHLGSKPEDLAITRLAWADLSAQFSGAPQPSGAAVFVSPDHPDYPPTWLTRHYGVLCVGWPGVTAATFQPGQKIHCRYRVWIHRGAPSDAQLAAAYRNYEAERQVRWNVE